MKKIKTLIVILSVLFPFSGIGQDNAIVVVDGFFIKNSKTETIDYLGKDYIKDTITIAADSAVKIIDTYGSNGLFIINTHDPKGDKSLKLRENLYFNNPPSVMINNYNKSLQDLKSLKPEEIDSIRIIPPLTRAIHGGLRSVGGLIIVETVDNPNKITIDRLSNSQLSSDTSFIYLAMDVKLPTFEIELDLSDRAEKELQELQETIIVQAYFRGIPIDKENEEYIEWGHVDVGGCRIELESKRIACFSDIKIPKYIVDKLEDLNVEVLINVFSGRRSSQFNILDVNILQEPINDIKGKKFTLRGKLIGE
ncbi:hypothetical protein DF185_06740 [Marinifilum breve]|uniref:TonB-dependent receptor plug domain-containing protein n=1 Tax=Marinifilum breve TaxID=2184082 RepID=A0A2V4A0T4_9BACT|nr:hypothetical protein [Marinifilum breve]PXY02339.1 hypothetical protein DF185_06740 [Marinifilum breve]